MATVTVAKSDDHPSSQPGGPNEPDYSIPDYQSEVDAEDDLSLDNFDRRELADSESVTAGNRNTRWKPADRTSTTRSREQADGEIDAPRKRSPSPRQSGNVKPPKSTSPRRDRVPLESNPFKSNPFESNLFESNPFESNPFESIPFRSIPFESNPFAEELSARNRYRTNHNDRRAAIMPLHPPNYHYMPTPSEPRAPHVPYLGPSPIAYPSSNPQYPYPQIDLKPAQVEAEQLRAQLEQARKDLSIAQEEVKKNKAVRDIAQDTALKMHELMEKAQAETDQVRTQLTEARKDLFIAQQEAKENKNARDAMEEETKQSLQKMKRDAMENREVIEKQVSELERELYEWKKRAHDWEARSKENTVERSKGNTVEEAYESSFQKRIHQQATNEYEQENMDRAEEENRIMSRAIEWYTQDEEMEEQFVHEFMSGSFGNTDTGKTRIFYDPSEKGTGKFSEKTIVDEARDMLQIMAKEYRQKIARSIHDRISSYTRSRPGKTKRGRHIQNPIAPPPPLGAISTPPPSSGIPPVPTPPSAISVPSPTSGILPPVRIPPPPSAISMPPHFGGIPPVVPIPPFPIFQTTTASSDCNSTGSDTNDGDERTKTKYALVFSLSYETGTTHTKAVCTSLKGKLRTWFENKTERVSHTRSRAGCWYPNDLVPKRSTEIDDLTGSDIESDYMDDMFRGKTKDEDVDEDDLEDLKRIPCDRLVSSTLLWESPSIPSRSELYEALWAQGWTPVYVRGSDAGQTWFMGTKPIHVRFIQPDYLPPIAGVTEGSNSYLLIGSEWVEKQALEMTGIKYMFIQQGYCSLDPRSSYADILSVVAASLLIRESGMRRASKRALMYSSPTLGLDDLLDPDLAVLPPIEHVTGIAESPENGKDTAYSWTALWKKPLSNGARN